MHYYNLIEFGSLIWESML